MPGPDPAVCSRRTRSHMMPSQLRKQSAEGLGQPRFWPAGRVFVGRGGAAGEEPRTYSGRGHGRCRRFGTPLAVTHASVSRADRCDRVHEKYICGAPRSRQAAAGTSAHACGRTAAASYAAAPDSRAAMSKSSAARRSPAWQSLPERLADAPRAGETVSPRAGLRSAHAGPAPAAMSIATADRTSPHPLTTTPAAPSHVPRHSLKGMTAVLLGRRERWRRWDAREAACPCSRRLADAAGLVVSSNVAAKPASRDIDFGVTYVAY
jgi:hypothetical protein